MNIVEAVHKAHATGTISLTVKNNDGVEVPTNVCTTFIKFLTEQIDPAQGDNDDLAKAADLVTEFSNPDLTNGQALGIILSYRRDIREKLLKEIQGE